MEPSDTAENKKIVHNLAYSICNLHVLVKQTTSSHQFWSSLGSCDHGAFLEGFELLGSRKAKNTFLLCTASCTDVDGSGLDSSEDLASFFVSSLLKKMEKIAMQMEDAHVSTVSSSHKSISHWPLQILFLQLRMIFNTYCIFSVFADEDRVQLFQYDFTKTKH